MDKIFSISIQENRTHQIGFCQFGYKDLEDACKSFENYLVDMIVEEEKVRDLTDVEEFLYCWKNLKSPVFMDLVQVFQ
jgi:hypothetical protein